MDSEPNSTEYWVVVEGPSPGDARFMARWFQSAVEADRLLTSVSASEPGFRKSINRVEIVSLIEFGPASMAFAAMWLNDLTAFSMDLLGSEWGEIFAVMTEIGFFTETGDRYQMTVPAVLTRAGIKSALIRLAATEDEEFFLHQERLVQTMSSDEAKQWRIRLDRIPWMQRVADRALLLENSADLE